MFDHRASVVALSNYSVSLKFPVRVHSAPAPAIRRQFTRSIREKITQPVHTATGGEDTDTIATIGSAARAAGVDTDYAALHVRQFADVVRSFKHVMGPERAGCIRKHFG